MNKRLLTATILAATFFLSPGILLAVPQAHIDAGNCAICHDIHGGFSRTPLLGHVDADTLCLSCHGPAGIATRAASHRTSEDSEYGRWRSSCLDCHDPHEPSPSPATLYNRFGNINLFSVGNDQYDPDVAGILFRTESDPDGEVLPVVFESRGTGPGGAARYSFADSDDDGDAIYDGICEVCHTQTKYHRQDGSGATGHHEGATCTTKCHQHAKGFIRKK